ncbi:Retrovirus-related Pol polyprotein from transposon 17.6, partial [Mucuna pruriens]
MCIDCKPINNITTKYRHRISFLDDLLDELHGSKNFSKIDLRSEYHQIKVRERINGKWLLRTKFGLYEWLIMPFNLTNALSNFMRLMNHVLRSLIGKCMVVYFDDFFIYSTCLDDHLLHFIINSHGVKVEEEKVKAIQDWPTPTMGEVRSFHELASFCRRFVKDFSTLPTPLNEILKERKKCWF